MRHSKRTLQWRLAAWGSERALVRWLLSPAIAPRLPALPNWLLARLGVEPPIGPRSRAVPPVPADLRTAPGVPRDPEQEASAFADSPLPVWIRKYTKADDYQQRRNWMTEFLTKGMRARGLRAVTRRGGRGTERSGATPADLTTHLKGRAAELGLSAVGIARYNPLYTFEPFVGENPR